MSRRLLLASTSKVHGTGYLDHLEEHLVELFAGVEELAAALPRGHADLKDQVRRAGAAVVRHIAEGASRVHPRDKAARSATHILVTGSPPTRAP